MLMRLEHYTEEDVISWTNQLLDALEFLHFFEPAFHLVDERCVFLEHSLYPVRSYFLF